MATPLLTQASSVLCSHAGTAAASTPNTRVLLSGQPSVSLSCTYIISGCPFSTPAGPLPCVSGLWMSGTTRVFSNGLPLLLSSGASSCAPNATPLVVLNSQLRVLAS